jgi:hypothetical protein
MNNTFYWLGKLISRGGWLFSTNHTDPLEAFCRMCIRALATCSSLKKAKNHRF